MRRREFIKTSAGATALIGPARWASLSSDLAAFGRQPNLSKVEARYYKKLPDREIECLLCPRACKLGDKERGYCGVRENIGGTYYTLVHGKACTVQVDPIEKKPFFHFLPGTLALSLASAGCNVNCKFCQNWEISQVRPEQVEHFDFPPDSVVRQAQETQSSSIAFTYSEPIVFYEYMFDTSAEARKKGIRNLVVTGGYINPEPLEKLMDVVDAIKVDLKSFSQDFYVQYVRGDLKPILEAIQLISKRRVWMEIVYLVIPSLNDSPEEIRRMCRWLLAEVGPDVPLHFSRFQPMYLLKNLPPTPVSTLENLWEIAHEEGLHYVYIGNVFGHPKESTACANCRKEVIRRFGYKIEKNELKGGKCGFCGHPIPGIWT